MVIVDIVGVPVEVAGQKDVCPEGHCKLNSQDSRLVGLTKWRTPPQVAMV